MRLKDYQQQTLEGLERYLAALRTEHDRAASIAKIDPEIDHPWDEKAWRAATGQAGYRSRIGGDRQRVPAVCIKLPTGGGKTLLATHAVDLIQRLFLRRQHGLVLWIVPTTQIYVQTVLALRDRAHPYRQQLDRASAGRTLIVEKDQRFTPADVREQLVVLVLMLPAANRQNRETLRMFQDQSGFELFFPPDDRWSEHEALRRHTPNLDVFEGELFGSIVKSSLGNTLRVLRPVVILDEGHKAYSDLAQQTLLGFNPAFILELSATPPPESNVLLAITGQQLLREGMIKLDIHVHNRVSSDWRDTMRAAHLRRQDLERIALDYYRNGGEYIRPLCLVQVDRTGAKQRKPEFIHAEDVREFLIVECGVRPDEVAIKSSERDDLDKLDLLDPECQIRYVITRYALQEGWDCPFAYVLATLTNTGSRTAVTQIVGRVLRQPYARKTPLAALNESYLYAFRESANELITDVVKGLSSEGLQDVSGRVVAGTDDPGTRSYGAGEEWVEAPVREHLRPLVQNKVYLPCFAINDGRNGWRELHYEMDILSRVAWDSISLDHFATLELNPTETQDTEVLVGLSGASSPLRTTTAADLPIDLTFMTGQLTSDIPNPWIAYDLAAGAIDLLRQRYDDQQIRRDMNFILEELRKQVKAQRAGLEKAVFDQLLEADRIRFFLLAGCAHATLPERIKVRRSNRLRDRDGDLVQRNLFEQEDAGQFNETERAVALYLDQQRQLLFWMRNRVPGGYRIQGWQRSPMYPDYVFTTGDEQIEKIYVVETKGIHLSGSADTLYKQELLNLCTKLSEPYPWDELRQEFSNHTVTFQVVMGDEWQRVLNELLS